MECKRKKIVIDADIPYIRGVLESYADVSYVAGAQIVCSDVADADALIVRTRTHCSRELLEGTKVGLIATATIGFDHIDTQYCATHGIEVATAAGCNARAVLQWVGAVLAYSCSEHGWKPSQKCLGVVGVGHVGSLVAHYGRLWGFDVVCCDPPRARAEGDKWFVSLGELATRADIVTFHVPLNLSGPDSTYHIANREFFARLSPDALLLNSSRGEVVDSEALHEAIDEGALEFAIDTWEREPAVDSSLVHAALLATPHIAGYSAQGKATATSMAIEAVARHCGVPLKGWYPPDAPVRENAVEIGWEQMCSTITGYFDIEAESSYFKGCTERFETIRNGYNYRKEYF